MGTYLLIGIVLSILLYRKDLGKILLTILLWPVAIYIAIRDYREYRREP